MKNLGRIASDLFNKIRGRFPNVTIGDETGNITNIPEDARYYDFSYFNNGEDLGKVSVSLDEDNGVVVIVTKDLVDGQMEDVQDGWYGFLRELRMFAKKRLLTFDVRDINKKQLNKKDYHFLAKNRTGEDQMSESKMYGTKNTSYQKIGNARLAIKHSTPIAVENTNSRTQKIKAIYVESPEGERFRYPYKHLSGARAMARHVSEGGNAYDDFGKYISGLSEEISKLRKFNQYLGRSAVMAETLGGYTEAVKNRVTEVKKEIQNLQKESYYQEAVSDFSPSIMEEVPTDVAENWIDQLTVKQFNEELADVFPFIYRLVGETTKAKELAFEDFADDTDTTKKATKESRKTTREEEELENGFEEMMGQFSEKSNDNFTPDDLNRLARIKDLPQAKKYALELISNKSAKPMKPEKVRWFANQLQKKKSVMDITKMMYDLLLAGEKNAVLGTTGGMGQNSYRKKFGDSTEENYPDGMDHSQLDGDDDVDGAVDHAISEIDYAMKNDSSTVELLKDFKDEAIANGAKGTLKDVAEDIIGLADEMAREALSSGGFGDSVEEAAFDSVFAHTKKQLATKFNSMGEDDMGGKVEKPKTPIGEFILSYFDRETGKFPKGETAVLTAVQKEYGDQYVKPSVEFIKQVESKIGEVLSQEDMHSQYPETNRVKNEIESDRIGEWETDPAQDQSDEYESYEYWLDKVDPNWHREMSYDEANKIADAVEELSGGRVPAYGILNFFEDTGLVNDNESVSEKYRAPQEGEIQSYTSDDMPVVVHWEANDDDFDIYVTDEEGNQVDVSPQDEARFRDEIHGEMQGGADDYGDYMMHKQQDDGMESAQPGDDFISRLRELSGIHR